MKSNQYKMYGAPISYYSGKARAYLRRKNIPYTEILATADVFRDLVAPKVGLAIMPVLVTPEDEWVQDTTEIIDFLEGRFPDQPVYPAGPKQRLAALLLELFGDEWLLHTALHYRWHYDKDWLYKEWGRMAAPGKPVDEQIALAKKQSEFFQDWLPSMGMIEKTIAPVEASYKALLVELNEHFAAYPFLFGYRPSIGDYGLIGPLYAHLYRDPTGGHLMRTLAPRVADWVERMEFALEPHAGEFLANDEVPDTVIAILKRAAREQFPVLSATASRIAAWSSGAWTPPPDNIPGGTPFATAQHTNEGSDAKPASGTSVPRYLGWHDVAFGEVQAPCRVRPYSQWMLQRPVDYYAGLPAPARDKADALLQSFGGESLASIRIEARVERRNFQLVLA